jgi:hypothetical protein
MSFTEQDYQQIKARLAQDTLNVKVLNVLGDINARTIYTRQPLRAGVPAPWLYYRVAGKWTAFTYAAGNFAPAYASVTTNQTTNSTSFTNLATSGPAVTVTTLTTALVTLTCLIQPNATAVAGFMNLAVSGATTINAPAGPSAAFQTQTSGTVASGTVTYVLTGLTAGSNTFMAKYAQGGTGAGGGTTAGFSERFITVIPGAT